MLVSSLLFRLVRCLLPLCVLATVWLYLFPFFHQCNFPKPQSSCNRADVPCFQTTTERNLAPFRLLAFGDPQLEGDSSLPDPNTPIFPSLRRLRSLLDGSTPLTSFANVVADVLQGLVKDDLPTQLASLRKRADLLGNDYYLAHIFRTLHWWSEPTHVSVLGDLLGSQWISDGEFDKRSWRYWQRVFKGASLVPDSVLKHYDHKSIEGDYDARNQYEEELGKGGDWSQRLINIAGNHDIGYAGDIDASRIARFEHAFGRVNWDMRFTLLVPGANSTQTNASVHLVVLNSMNLDGPAKNSDLQRETFDFLNEVITYRSRPVEDHTSFTLLLTHIPLHKAAGICVDAPYFTYFPDYHGGGVREQNHLSEYASHQGVLQGIFGKSGDKSAPMSGLGRNGLIINGHDHEGCDVWHHVNQDEDQHWHATKYQDLRVASNTSRSGHSRDLPRPGIRELTLRAMMGEYGGNAGLVSLWFDWNEGEWRYDVKKCAMGVQHWWWAVHILDLITIGLIIVTVPLHLLQSPSPSQAPSNATVAQKKGSDSTTKKKNQPTTKTR